MCAEAYFDDKCIETVGELRALCHEIVWCDPAMPTCDDTCLCCVNIRATADANGFAAFRDDMGDYTLTRAGK